MCSDADTQTQAVQTWIDAHKALGKPILLYYIWRESRIPDEYFRAIYDEIQHDFSQLTVHGIDTDKFSMPGDMLPLPGDCLKHLHGVNIILVIDEYPFSYPDDAFVIAFPHSFLGYDYPLDLNSMKWKQYLFDAYITTTPQTLRDAELLRATFEFHINPAKIRRKRREFLFIPLGCPRVAVVQKKLEQYTAVQDSLLYAPTGYWSNPGEPCNKMIGTYGSTLIKNLLTFFPEYRIVFRPCVSSWDHPDVLALIEAHEGHPRFVVSRDFDHTPEFARAATVLTEYSNIGEVFALASLRPEVRMTLEHVGHKPEIMRTGVSVHPEGDVMDAVCLALRHKQQFWRAHIRKAWNTYIIPPNAVFKRIHKALVELSAKRYLTHCVAIKRDHTRPPWCEQDYIAKIFRNGYFDSGLAKEFYQNFPDDHAALCCYLLMHKMFNPTYYIQAKHSLTPEALKMLTETGCIVTEKSLFGDLSINILRTLLLRAKLKAIKSGNLTYDHALDVLLELSPPTTEPQHTSDTTSTP